MRGALLFVLMPFFAVTAGGCGSLIVTQQSAEQLRGRPGFTWTAVATNEHVVHAEAGSALEPKLDAISQSASESRKTVLAGLEMASYEMRFEVFVVETRDRMKDLIGRRTNATGYHASNALCIVWPRAGAIGLRHEMVHVVAMNAWGVPERWVNEGLAVDVAGPWAGRDVDAVCKVLRERDELPSLDEITKRFERLSSAVSYPAAGSFVRFVRAEHGFGAVRSIWNGGSRSLASSTGRSRAALEAAWLARVDTANAQGVTYDPVAITPSDDR